MTVFWIIAGATTLLVAALLVAALMRGRRETGPAEAWDLQVYRDQLREIERDAARGAIAPDEAERLKTEVSRRILAADAKIHGGKPAAPRASARCVSSRASTAAASSAATRALRRDQKSSRALIAFALSAAAWANGRCHAAGRSAGRRSRPHAHRPSPGRGGVS